MKMIHKTRILALTATLISSTALAAPVAEKLSYATGACTEQENWKYSGQIPDEVREEMADFLSGKTAPVRGFAEALAVRRQHPGGEARIFSEYWISRALLKANLHHIAFSGFSKIASYNPDPETLGVQASALECLARIHHQYPSITLPKAAYENLPLLLSFSKKQGLWEFAGTYLRQQLTEGASKGQLQDTLKYLKGAGAHESFARGVVAARFNQNLVTVEKLNAFFASPNLPASLVKFKDHGHLLLSRAYFALQNYTKGTQEIGKIRKSSNELSTALSELSWHYLMDFKLTEAIGAGMSLQAGGMRHTFAPEAPMVIAMALNELCQFPESLRVIAQFRRNYEKPYRWLSQWSKGPRDGLYAETVNFMKKQSKIPVRVGSELARTPIFISNQEEINLIFRERANALTLGKSGSAEQKKLASSILSSVSAIKPRIKAERSRLKPGQPLPKSLQGDLVRLKDEMNHFRRMRNGAGPWHMILSNHNRKLPALEKELVAKVEKELKKKSLRMVAQIEEIAENNQLIEVEIYNGASQDIIWQNAHPEYKKLAQEMNDQNKGVSGGKVWNWGRAPAQFDQSDDDKVEVWEDELGAFKANLFDNCDSKEKFLAIKRKSK